MVMDKKKHTFTFYFKRYTDENCTEPHIGRIAYVDEGKWKSW